MSRASTTRGSVRLCLAVAGAVSLGMVAACGGASAPAHWDATPAGMEPPASVFGEDELALADDEARTSVDAVDATVPESVTSDNAPVEQQSAGVRQRDERTTSGGTMTAPSNPPILLAGPNVDPQWLGGAWDGAPVRLAANPGALDGQCAAAPTVPDDTHFAVPASAVVGAGLELPSDAWLIVTLTSVDRAADRCVSAAGARHVVEIGRGGLLVVSGPVDSGVHTPGDALARRDLVVHGFTGWSMDGGAWRPGHAPVWARLAVPTHARPDLCADAIDEAIDDLVAAAWARHLGSPVARAHADGRLRARAFGPTEVENLAAVWVDGVGPADAMHRLADADAVLAACGSSQGARAVVALLEDAAGLPDAALESLAVRGTGERSVPLRALAAMLHWRSGNDAAALEMLDSVLDLDVDRFDARLLRARIVRDAVGDAARARAALDALDPPPEWAPTVAHELGTALDDLGEVAAAIDAWTRAAIDDPAWAEPANALGVAHFTRGQVEDARVWFATAIDRDASHASAHNNLGFLLEQVDGDIDRAEAMYRRATTLDPGLASAWYNLGWLLETWRADLDGAEAAYRETLRASPDHVDAAVAVARLGDRPDATIEALVGSWSTTFVDDGGAALIIATFFGDGRVTFVERSAGRLPRTRTGPVTVEDRSGARMSGHIGGDIDAPFIIEFIADDRVLLLDPTDPDMRRVYERLVGDDLATVRGTAG